MITFNGVTKRYADGTVAVDNLSLEVPTGEITVFVGPSGCGKTTSLRMINRMIDADGGPDPPRRRRTSETIDPPTLRRGIGYVIQHAGLFPHRKIVDNVATVPLLLGWDKKKARARAMELLERVGLRPQMANRYPYQLSGGQQQRVGVARALAADPPVLLMDEPFSAVDPIVRDEPAGGVPPAADGAAQDHRVRHPRHRRGDQARRPDRGAPHRGQAGAVRRPRSDCSPHPADDFVARFPRQGPWHPPAVLRLGRRSAAARPSRRAGPVPRRRGPPARPAGRRGRLGCSVVGRRAAYRRAGLGRRAAPRRRTLATRRSSRTDTASSGRRDSLGPRWTTRVLSATGLAVGVDAEGRVRSGTRGRAVRGHGRRRARTDRERDRPPAGGDGVR